MSKRLLIAAILGASAASAQTVTITGTVHSISGAPIQGAVCQFKGITNKAVTDAAGKFSFSGSVGIRQAEGYTIAMASQGRRLAVKLEQPGRIALDLFDLSGKRLHTLADREMAAGSHSLEFAPPRGSHQLYILRFRMGTEVAWHKVAIQNGIASLTGVASASVAAPLSKTGAAMDSLFCTEASHHGGLARINGRAVATYAGNYGIRMFSSDPAWKAQCAPPMTFNFDNSPGVAKFKTMIPDWVGTEHEVLMEVCQATFKKATQPRKYASYIANIKNSSGVANTGGNTLNFNADYIDGQPTTYAGWLEIVGVLVHEAVHSYQAYYNTAGAAGFGESMPDAVRALTGFFKWPKGTKCTGSYADAYQTGGKYWYFIELKHPGFLTTVWQQTAGDIATRVEAITGESLTSLSNECKTTGMPF
jgi:hypothetical protein